MSDCFLTSICRQSSWNSQSAEQTIMARLVLPYISFIVFLLLMCMATQPGTGITHSDEGQDILCSAFYLYIYIYIFLYSFTSYIGSNLFFQNDGNGHLYIQLCSSIHQQEQANTVQLIYNILLRLITLILYRCIMCVSVCLFYFIFFFFKGFYKEVQKTSNNFLSHQI